MPGVTHLKYGSDTQNNIQYEVKLHDLVSQCQIIYRVKKKIQHLRKSYRFIKTEIIATRKLDKCQKEMKCHLKRNDPTTFCVGMWIYMYPCKL